MHFHAEKQGVEGPHYQCHSRQCNCLKRGLAAPLVHISSDLVPELSLELPTLTDEMKRTMRKDKARDHYTFHLLLSPGGHFTNGVE